MLMVTRTSKLLLFRLYASCCFLFSYHVVAGAAESPFSFSFDLSDGYTRGFDELRFEGTAGLHDGLVDLTNNLLTKPVGNCTGRLSYYDAVPFYATTTGYLASFSTRFSFLIRVVNTSGARAGAARGHGMTFFLSDYPLVPLKSCRGNGNGMNSGGINSIVAVEFDTIGNAHDHSSSGQMGININSADVSVSVNTTSFPNLSGTMTASITFNSSTGMLVASLHIDDNPSRASYQVSTRLTNPVTTLLQSELVVVGFSAATGANIELHQILSWSFNSTLDWSTYRKGNKFKRSIEIFYLLFTVGLVILVLLFYAVVIWIQLAYGKHKNHADAIMEGTGESAKRFEYEELDTATDRFCESRILGHGAVGVVYEGKWMEQDGQYHQVAVKKFKGSNGDFQDFHAELRTTSETRQKNLVGLKGWCSRNKSNLFYIMCWWRQKHSIDLFLVYELLPNGNLDVHLNKMERVLSWEKRYNIAKGIGSALRYLHHECNMCILHRNVESANILLDEQFNAKLGGFRLSRIAHKKNEAVPTTATEMTQGGLNTNSDVYSFGIVLLEIACTGKDRDEVWDLYKYNSKNMVAAADIRLNGDFHVAEMHRVAVLGLWCSVLDGARRPSMVQAMKVLEDGETLPNLIEYDSEVAVSEGNESDPLLCSAPRHLARLATRHYR